MFTRISPIYASLAGGLLLIAAVGSFVLLTRPVPSDDLPRRSAVHTVPLSSGGASSDIWVRLEWPERMRMDHSSWIEVTLAQSRADAEAWSPADLAVSAPAISVPEANGLARAFGDGLDAIVLPLMHATAFDVLPGQVSERPLDDSAVRWEWNLQPRHRGDQSVSLGIDARWSSGDSPVAQREIWRAQIPIYVEQPLLTTGGQISLIRVVSWIAAALGTGLVLPLLSRILLDRHSRGER